jgi:hypothetical protein
MSLKWPSKDPDETLDFSIDWSRFLEGRFISSGTWYFYDANGVKTQVSDGNTVDGLTSGAQYSTTSVTTIVLSNGTRNKDYKVGCSIVFGDGLVAERTVRIRIRDGS